MKRMLVLLCVALALTAGHATAQITLDEAYFRAQVGKQFATTTYEVQDLTGVAALAATTGNNRTFDFSGFTYEPPVAFTSRFLPRSSEMPGASDPFFAPANYVAFTDNAIEYGVDGQAYGYFDLKSDGLFLLGAIVIGDFDEDGQDEQGTLKNDPAEQVFLLPLTAGTTWSYSTTTTFDVDGAAFSFDSTVEVEVDGWGTLVTPAGSAACLRLRTTQETTIFDITTTTTSISYVSRGNFSADIELDEQGNVVSAGYTVLVEGGTPNEPGPEVPRAISLGQNYPNPFNPATVIPFDLAQPAAVTLTVYNTLGQQVATLIDEVVPAGPRTVTFRADDLPSGVYLYRLQAGNTVTSRAMILHR